MGQRATCIEHFDRNYLAFEITIVIARGKVQKLEINIMKN